MMETQMTMMGVHLHEQLRLDMFVSMATLLVVMNALKHVEMVMIMEDMNVMMETWLIMMDVTVNDTLRNDISA